MKLTATTFNGTSETVDLDPEDMNHVHVEFSPSISTEREIPVTAAVLTVGTNIRGWQFRIDTSKTSMLLSTSDLSDRVLTFGAGTLTARLAWTVSGLIARLDQVELDIAGTATMVYDGGEFLITEFAIPDDADYIVTGNTLYPGIGVNWGFDDVIKVIDETDVFGSKIAELRISDNFDEFPPETVIFERRCPPESPFYVRWVNRNGGYSYQMFDGRQTEERAISDLQTFESYISDTTTATSTTETIDLNASVFVRVGLEVATREQFEWLSLLPLSPRIEWWNERLQSWFRINISGDQSHSWISDAPTGRIEFRFEMPRKNIQF